MFLFSNGEKIRFARDTVHALVTANIPMQKPDHPAMREWFNEYVKLLYVPTLCTTYLQSEVKCEEEEKVKETVTDQQVVVLCDKRTNCREACVLFVCSVGWLGLAAVKVLNNTNSSVCSQTLMTNQIEYENVPAFISDSANYMNKCAELLKVLRVCLLYIQC
ncbi:hypothetical protein PR048_016540 [Dryococelus australis]|uniref:Uncharacterized protein n=1 Tax=Dryococelus australis TaxID=614101 RepID=A0ABQ9HK06_9NEOP|nr:hypothetical protein PR048_016540 [Dryococelus australis]